MRVVSLGIVIAFVLNACTKTERTIYYTPEEVQRITDSALKANLKVANEAAQKDLEYRKSIELKWRMDSIKAAEKQK